MVFAGVCFCNNIRQSHPNSSSPRCGLSGELFELREWCGIPASTGEWVGFCMVPFHIPQKWIAPFLSSSFPRSDTVVLARNLILPIGRSKQHVDTCNKWFWANWRNSYLWSNLFWSSKEKERDKAKNADWKGAAHKGTRYFINACIPGETPKF